MNLVLAPGIGFFAGRRSLAAAAATARGVLRRRLHGGAAERTALESPSQLGWMTAETRLNPLIESRTAPHLESSLRSDS